MEQWKIEQVSLAGYSFRVENDEFVFVGDIPSQSELDAIFEKYDAKKYQRDRNYPDIGEQLDMLYWDKKNDTKNWEDAIDKVKADNPKPE